MPNPGSTTKISFYSIAYSTMVSKFGINFPRFFSNINFKKNILYLLKKCFSLQYMKGNYCTYTSLYRQFRILSRMCTFKRCRIMAIYNNWALIIYKKYHVETYWNRQRNDAYLRCTAFYTQKGQRNYVPSVFKPFCKTRRRTTVTYFLFYNYL